MIQQFVSALMALAVYDAFMRRGGTFALLVFGYMLAGAALVDGAGALIRRLTRRPPAPRPPRP